MRKVTGRQFSVFLMFIILCCFLMTATPLGNRLLISALEKSMPRLTLELSQGSLLFSPQFSHFNYTNDYVEITATDITANWNISCLWRSSICFKSASADTLSINIVQRDSNSQRTTKTSKTSKAIALVVNNTSVNTFLLTHEHFKLEGKTLNASFELMGRNIAIEHLNAASLSILKRSHNTTHNEPVSQSLTQQVQSIQNALSRVAAVTMPVNISLNKSVIKQVNYQQEISASPTLPPNRDNVLNVQNLTTSFIQQQQEVTEIVIAGDTQKDAWQLQGNFTLAPELNHQLSINSQFSRDGFGKTSTLINSAGNINQLQFNGQSTGQITAKISGDVSLTKPAIPLNLNGTWQPFSIEPLNVNLSSGNIELSGHLSHLLLKADTAVTAPNIPLVQGTLNGHISEQGIELANSQLKLLNGKAILNGNITWQEQLALTTQVKLQHIEPQQYWPDFHGEFNGSFHSNLALDDNKQWRVHLSNLAIIGQLFNESISLSGQVIGHATDQPPKATNHNRWGHWQLDDITLKHAQNLLKINGQLAQNTNIDAVISATNIGTSLPRFKHTTPGSINGKTTLSGDIDNLNFNAQLSAKNIYYQPNDMTFKQASLTASATLSEDLPLDISFSATGINYQDQSYQNTLSASLIGDKKNHAFNAVFNKSKVNNSEINNSYFNSTNLTSDNQFNTRADLSIIGQFDNHQWLGKITTANIIKNEQILTLTSPFLITANTSNNSITVDTHCWSTTLNATLEPSSLCLNAPFVIDTKMMRSNEANFKLSNFSIRHLQPYLPKQHQVNGLVDGEFNFQVFSHDELNLSSTLQWLNGTIDSEFNDSVVGHKITKLTVNAAIDRQFANIIAHLSSPTLGIINASVVSNVFDAKPFINGHIRSEGLELAPYRPFLNNISSLNGQISVSAGFSGDLEQQQIYGQLTSTDISIASDLLPNKIDNLTTQLDFNGTNATFNSSFNLANGQGSINGLADWKNSLNAQFSLQGNSLALTPQKGINLVVSPDLSVSLTKQIAKIRGDLTIDSADVNIKSLPSTAIGLSDDVIVKQTLAETHDHRTNQTFDTAQIDIDVNTLLGKQFTIDAFGLKSAIEGDLNITQNQLQPLSSYGKLSLVDAKYKAFGQYLDIETGQLTFTGSIYNPILNIKAVRDANDTEDDVIVGVNINGAVDNPELTIFSMPAMEEQQALSYLMRGRAIDANEEFGSDMAIALIVNSGLSGASNMIDNVGNAVGINNFNVTTSGAGESTRLKFSGSIGPNLQLQYGVGVFDALPEVGLRYKINKQLFIEFINDTDQALDILYQFSFD